MVDLSQIRLREATVPPYQTEGSAFSGSAGNLKIDNNFVLLANFLRELQTSANVPDYDNGAEYTAASYDVVKHDDKLYLATFTGSPAEFSGIVPTNPTYWTEISVGAISHNQNRDQYLDRGGQYEVSVVDVYNKIHGCTCLKYKKVTLTASEVQAMFSVPQVLLASSPGILYDVDRILIDNNFDEDSPGDTPYNTYTDIRVKANGADLDMFHADGFLANSIRVINRMKPITDASGGSQTQYVPAESVNAYCHINDPVGGTHGLVFYIFYSEISI